MMRQPRFAQAARVRDPAEARRLRFEAPQARGLLVIIQMLSEAARFRYIENRVGGAMREYNQPFYPDALTRSLETHWANLSQQIQRVKDPPPANGGGLPRPVSMGSHEIGKHYVEVTLFDQYLLKIGASGCCFTTPTQLIATLKVQ
ncbi:hypothetical protein ACFX2A_039048 [Malus domestica]